MRFFATSFALLVVLGNMQVTIARDYREDVREEPYSYDWEAEAELYAESFEQARDLARDIIIELRDCLAKQEPLDQLECTELLLEYYDNEFSEREKKWP